MPDLHTRFRRVFYKLLPRYLTEGEGQLVLYSLGVIKDAFVERAHQGLYARFPSYAPADALPYIGRDRKIVRGIDEPDDAYAARLQRWLDDHQVRGNPFALLEQLRAYCQANVRVRTVDRRGNWFTIERDGSRSVLIAEGNWDWDGAPLTQWSRFWVIIYPTADGKPWAPNAPIGDPTLWGAGVVGTPKKTIGTTATPEQVAAVRNIVREWQPDGTRCEWIIIAFDDDSFYPTTPDQPDPDPGSWSKWGKLVGTDYVRARAAGARYWKGSGIS